MFRKALVAFAATSAIALAAAPAAEAKTKVNFDLGINVGGGGVIIDPGFGVYDDDFYVSVDDDFCGWQKVKHKKWNKAHTKKVIYFSKEWVCG